jgi:Arc/MetJ-type ribon-helix-helix transcriptional regulator
MGEYSVHLDPKHHRILNDLIRRKIFKSRNEAINAGILLLGKKYGVDSNKMKANKMRNKDGYLISEKSLSKIWSSKIEDEAWEDL